MIIVVFLTLKVEKSVSSGTVKELLCLQKYLVHNGKLDREVYHEENLFGSRINDNECAFCVQRICRATVHFMP